MVTGRMNDPSMRDQAQHPNASAEIQAAEQASRELLAVLGPGGFRARVERRVVNRRPGDLLGHTRELLVDGVVVWRARWVAEGAVSRLDTQWMATPESFRA